MNSLGRHRLKVTGWPLTHARSVDIFSVPSGFFIKTSQRAAPDVRHATHMWPETAKSGLTTYRSPASFLCQALSGQGAFQASPVLRLSFKLSESTTEKEYVTVQEMHPPLLKAGVSPHCYITVPNQLRNIEIQKPSSPARKAPKQLCVVQRKHRLGLIFSEISLSSLAARGLSVSLCQYRRLD